MFACWTQSHRVFYETGKVSLQEVRVRIISYLFFYFLIFILIIDVLIIKRMELGYFQRMEEKENQLHGRIFLILLY